MATVTGLTAEKVLQIRDAGVVSGKVVNGNLILVLGSNAEINVGPMGGVDVELVRDTVGATLVAGTNISIVVDDAGNTITINGPAVKTRKHIQKHLIFGHSGAEPYGVIHPASWASRVSSALGAEEVNFAISGSVLARSDYDAQRGGYATALNWMRPFVSGRSGNRFNVRKVAPYLPPADLISMQWISNDLGLVSTTRARSAAMAQDTLIALIAARARAGAVWNVNDLSSSGGPGFTWGTGWSTTSPGLQTSTDGVGKQSTTVGSFFDFQCPADHEGEFVFVIALGGGFGGTYQFYDTTDGLPGNLIQSSNTIIGAGGPAAPNFRVKSIRVSVAAGARKIRCILTDISGATDGTTVTTALVDSVSLTAVDNPPLVVLGTHPKGPGIAQADVDLITGAVDAAVAAFSDGRVVKADMAALCASTTIGGVALNDIPAGSRGAIWRAADGHANEMGHSIQSKLWLDTIAAAPDTPNKMGDYVAASGMTHRVVQPVNTITAEACLSTNWTAVGLAAVGSQGLTYTKDKSNIVKFRGGLSKSTAPAALEQLFSKGLPAAYRPLEPVFFSADVFTTAGVFRGAAKVCVGIDGLFLLVTTGGALATDVITCDAVEFVADGGMLP